MLLPILFLTPSRAIAGVLAGATDKQLRLSWTVTTCTPPARLPGHLAEPLYHCVREVTDILDIRHSKDWADGDTGDKWSRGLPLLFPHKRYADVFSLTATAQGIVFVFQRERNHFFGQIFAVRTMLPRTAPLRQSWYESLPVDNFVGP